MKNTYKKAFTGKEKLQILKLLHTSSIYFIAHQYHITIQTIYRWKKLYNGTIQSLENHFSRKEMHHPKEQTEEEKKYINDLVKRNKHIGLNELYGKLYMNYNYRRHPLTLYRYLRKIGYYNHFKHNKPYIPQPYDTPKEIGIKMQMDVKFVPAECKAKNISGSNRYYQYTIIDERSRKRFIYPYEDLCGTSTVDFVKRAIKYFGYKPNIIQTDNGSEFTYTKESKQKHILDKFCEYYHIEHKTIRPRTPRHNGKVERSHRNDNERFYKYLSFYSFEDLKSQMQAYLNRSNNIPTTVLHWKTPNQVDKELKLKQWGVICD